jgi:hypothetical protein
MICTKCQKDIAVGSKFCYMCGAKQPEIAVGPNWADGARILAIIALANASHYYGWESVVGFVLLLVAFLLLAWLLARLFRFLWHRFLQRGWAILGAWWECRRKQCDYYQIYQAHGPRDLTHLGYHAGERLAIEHFVNHSGGSHRGCDVCKNWAERLRGEFWTTLMGGSRQPGTDAILETKQRQFGFLGGTRKTQEKSGEKS